MAADARRPLSIAAKFVFVSHVKFLYVSLLLSCLINRSATTDAETGILLQKPEKRIAGGTLEIDDLTVAPPYYGNRVSDRKNSVELTHETYVLSDVPLAEGILKRFFVYFQKPLGAVAVTPSPSAKTVLQIWRPEYAISTPVNKVYTLVYSISVGLVPDIGTNGTMTTYLVDKFVTVSGDVMGFTVDQASPLPISCGRNRTRDVLVLASPKTVQLTEEYDFPQQSVQRLSCAMAVEVVPIDGCTLCNARQNLHAFAKKAKPQDLPEQAEAERGNSSSGETCMQGNLSCEAATGIIGGILGMCAIALVILGVVQCQMIQKEMNKPSHVSSTGRRRT